jgi:hypothetical protein
MLDLRIPPQCLVARSGLLSSAARCLCGLAGRACMSQCQRRMSLARLTGGGPQLREQRFGTLKLGSALLEKLDNPGLLRTTGQPVGHQRDEGTHGIQTSAGCCRSCPRARQRRRLRQETEQPQCVHEKLHNTYDVYKETSALTNQQCGEQWSRRRKSAR